MITGTGTLGYTAPEILNANEGDAKSASYNNKVDMWSLGCVLFRMIHGRNLFSSNDEVKRLSCVTLYMKRHFKDWVPDCLKSQESELVWKLVCLDVKTRLDAPQALDICGRWKDG